LRTQTPRSRRNGPRRSSARTHLTLAAGKAEADADYLANASEPSRAPAGSRACTRSHAARVAAIECPATRRAHESFTPACQHRLARRGALTSATTCRRRRRRRASCGGGCDRSANLAETEGEPLRKAGS
jgi:hypothetical protein